MCDTHGGMAPQVRAKASRRILEATVAGRMIERGWEPMLDPLAALADQAGESWAWKELCREQANDLGRWDTLDAKGTEQIRARIELYERAQDRSHKQLIEMLRLGVDVQALQLAKNRPSREQAETLSRILDHVLTGLDLDDTQRGKVPALLTTALQTEGLTP